MKPTLYYHFFMRNNCNEYDVWESHTCQEKGCIMTNKCYISTCLPGKVEKFVEEFQHDLPEGVVDEIHVDYIGVEK